MAEHSHQFALASRIVELSEANSWNAAKLEWKLDSIWFVQEGDEPETCLCGHYPIIEVCVIQNRENGNVTEVGNVCVNKFLGLGSKIIFDGIKRVRGDITKALNGAAIDYAYEKRWINSWEHGFLHDTKRKRRLSFAQADKREQLNKKVLRLSVRQES